MNKKQWYTLGFMFLVFTMLFSYCVNYTYSLSSPTYPMYVLLSCLSFMAMAACWICGWLETK